MQILGINSMLGQFSQIEKKKKKKQKHQSFPEKMLPLIVNQIRPERERERDRQTDRHRKLGSFQFCYSVYFRFRFLLANQSGFYIEKK